MHSKKVIAAICPVDLITRSYRYPAHFVESRVLAWRDRLRQFVDRVVRRICIQKLYRDRLDISDMIGIHRRKATKLGCIVLGYGLVHAVMLDCQNG